ncbi:MAG: SGNH/GDSL hydrolase family protein, partial [Clostridiales bacterium]|nr:SGNH/GDSL hydrolase family protein [Clostridiales bacterium]
MLLYFLGSSVTYGSATNGRSFVEELAAQTSWECVKEAVSGTTLAVRDGDNNSSYVARLKNFDKDRRPAKLVVQLSTNDATQNVPLGKLSDSEAYDVKTIIGAIEFIICYAR